MNKKSTVWLFFWLYVSACIILWIVQGMLGTENPNAIDGLVTAATILTVGIILVYFFVRYYLDSSIKSAKKT